MSEDLKKKMNDALRELAEKFQEGIESADDIEVFYGEKIAPLIEPLIKQLGAEKKELMARDWAGLPRGSKTSALRLKEYEIHNARSIFQTFIMISNFLYTYLDNGDMWFSENDPDTGEGL